MIKKEYLGQTIRVDRRKIEVYQGMPKSEIKFLAEHGVDILEPKPAKVDKTRKKENYKGIEEEKNEQA